MNLIGTAYAMGAPAGGAEGGGNPIAAFLPLILMFAIFYFLLIRPQQKKAKQQKEMLQNLKVGDYVLTGGGMYGTITKVKDDVLTVELADNLTVKVNRNFVSGLAQPAQGAPAADKNE